LTDGGAPVPKDDRELSFALEVSSGELLERHGLPSAKLATTYTRKWEHRGRGFFRKAVEYAGTDEDGLVDRVGADDTFADALATAGQKATLSGDEVMHDWLARLVAAAFNDDAKVDTVAFLIGIVAQLEPVHLRELRDLARPLRSPWPVWVEVGEGVLERHLAEKDLQAAVMLRLASFGLVENKKAGWRAQSLGKQLVDLCEQVAEVDATP
jgi:hypothetical protein